MNAAVELSEEPTVGERLNWLRSYGLFDSRIAEDELMRRFAVFSCFTIGDCAW